MTDSELHELSIALDRLSTELGRFIEVFGSGAYKIIVSDPSWNELDTLLTEDEVKACVRFIATMMPRAVA